MFIGVPGVPSFKKTQYVFFVCVCVSSVLVRSHLMLGHRRMFAFCFFGACFCVGVSKWTSHEQAGI